MPETRSMITARKRFQPCRRGQAGASSRDAQPGKTPQCLQKIHAVRWYPISKSTRENSTNSIEATKTEAKCVHYGFSFNGDEAHCREGYDDAEGVLAHLENIGALLDDALKIADITRLEVHGPAAELDKLREPLKDLSPAYFELLDGIRR